MPRFGPFAPAPPVRIALGPTGPARPQPLSRLLAERGAPRVDIWEQLVAEGCTPATILASLRAVAGARIIEHAAGDGALDWFLDRVEHLHEVIAECEAWIAWRAHNAELAAFDRTLARTVASLAVPAHLTRGGENYGAADAAQRTMSLPAPGAGKGQKR